MASIPKWSDFRCIFILACAWLPGVLLSSVPPVLTGPPVDFTLSRQEYFRSAFSDHIFENHGLLPQNSPWSANGSNSTPLECLAACLYVIGCQSVNFHDSSKGGVSCGLNDATQQSFPQDLKARTGYVYMELDPDSRASITETCKSRVDLGMESGKIRNSSITASSHDEVWPPSKARLHGSLGWSTRSGEARRGEWLQVDLQSLHILEQIGTQGASYYRYFWVKSYYLVYTVNGSRWQFYTANNTIKLFSGNTDASTEVRQTLPFPVMVRKIRIVVDEFYYSSGLPYICLRLELYGCKV